MKKVSVPIVLLVVTLSMLSFNVDNHRLVAKSAIVHPIPPTTGQINWLSWEDAIELNKVEKRKILVNIYTDHCGWCTHMDRTTYKQANLVKYINENFYAVRLNAEYRKPIEFKDKTYKYVKSGDRGYHELAASITMGGLGTPAMVFIDENLEVIQPMLGYKDPDNFEVIITYFGENQYLITPWDIYQSNYIPMTKPQLMSDEDRR